MQISIFGPFWFGAKFQFFQLHLLSYFRKCILCAEFLACRCVCLATGFRCNLFVYQSCWGIWYFGLGNGLNISKTKASEIRAQTQIVTLMSTQPNIDKNPCKYRTFAYTALCHFPILSTAIADCLLHSMWHKHTTHQRWKQSPRIGCFSVRSSTWRENLCIIQNVFGDM